MIKENYVRHLAEGEEFKSLPIILQYVDFPNSLNNTYEIKFKETSTDGIQINSNSLINGTVLILEEIK